MSWLYGVIYRGENFNLDEKEQLELKEITSAGCNTELAHGISAAMRNMRQALLKKNMAKKIIGRIRGVHYLQLMIGSFSMQIVSI